MEQTQMKVDYEKKSQITTVQGLALDNFQEFPSRYFTNTSDKLRYILLDFTPGSGKSLIALNIMKGNYMNAYIIGNMTSQQQFQQDIKAIGIAQDRVQFMSYQQMVSYDELSLLEIFKGQLIIVDEFQKLYSQAGLNLAGQKLQYVCSNILDKIKIVGLSGTLLNATADEMYFVLNIFEGTDKYNSENLSKDELVKKMQPHILSYQTDISHDKHFPKVIDEHCLCECLMSDEQYKKSQENQELQQIGLFNKMNQLLYRHYYNPNQQQPLSHDILEGDVLQLDNLKKYAPVSHFVMNSILERFKNGQRGKIAMYNDFINAQWGITQYEKILEENGFVQYENDVKHDTICIFCGVTREKHPVYKTKFDEINFIQPKITLDHEQQLYRQQQCFATKHILSQKEINQLKDSKNQHAFTPARFIVFKSDVDQQQRNKYVLMFNDMINNQDGEKCVLIILTKIAETGLNLKQINYFYILDYVPTLSLHQQIVARAVRRDSHITLPKDRQFVQIYNMVQTSKLGTTNIKQLWLNMLQKGDELIQLMSKIRAHKKDYGIIQDSIFDQADKQYLQQYLAHISMIEYDELVDLIKHDEFIQAPFSYKNITKEQLEEFIMGMFIYEKDMKRFNDEKSKTPTLLINRELNFNQYQLQSRIKMENFSEVTIDVKKESILKQLINQVYNMKHYIKSYVQYIQEDYNEYILPFNNNISAYFIYEGLVYMKDDETKFAENHKKLWQEVYDKQFKDVIKNQQQLVQKLHIQGFYYCNKCYIKDQEPKKITQYVVDDRVQFSITFNLSQYKINGKDIISGLIKYIPENKLIKEDEFNKLSVIYKSRYNLMYYYQQDLVDGFVF